MNGIEEFYKFLDIQSKICNGRQAEILKQKRQDLRLCKMSLMSEIFSSEEINEIRKMIKVKECFRNAFITAESLPNVKYIEGEVLVCGIPIYHAFCKIGDKYFDPTLELVLNEDTTENSYAVMGEYDVDYVRSILIKTKVWGDIYYETLKQKFYETSCEKSYRMF